jgi:photosystem I subunit 8
VHKYREAFVVFIYNNNAASIPSFSVQYFFRRRPHMATSFLPSILVPLVGLVFPAVTMAALFLYIEKEEIN